VKPGDMVTWAQRDDLRELPTPYHRLGLILQRDDNFSRDFKVLWLKSQNTTYHDEDGLEVIYEGG
jgi:hypothetical protein